jgi:hypothetical protein
LKFCRGICCTPKFGLPGGRTLSFGRFGLIFGSTRRGGVIGRTGLTGRFGLTIGLQFGRAPVVPGGHGLMIGRHDGQLPVVPGGHVLPLPPPPTPTGLIGRQSELPTRV